MGKLIFLNDVATSSDGDLIIGNTEISASAEGQKQADAISIYLHKKIPIIDYLYSSTAPRLLKLVHNIRIRFDLMHANFYRVKELNERSFGILNRTFISFESDLFSQTRITADGGESIFQCRKRIMEYIQNINQHHPDKTTLLVSHPFLCQIAMNAILQKDHTFLTEFWITKGSFVQFIFEQGRYGIKWGFHSGYNALSDTTYNQDEIYSNLLGAKRAFSH